MPLAGVLTALSLLPLLLFSSSPCHATHNITSILAAHRDLGNFDHLLTATGLAGDINSRNTLTVLAVDDAAIAPLVSRSLPLPSLRHVLSLHVLVDYYDAAKLHRLPGGSGVVATLYQASGEAPGSAGMVNITVRRGGRVAFAAYDSKDAPPTVFYVRSIHETPYNISVVQVSSVISSPAAEAPVSPEAKPNLMDIMSKNGCRGFANLVAGKADAAKTYEQSIDGGLTVFCPADKAVTAFAPEFKNLTADGQLALLLYHGVPTHYSLQEIKTNNGDMNTMATDGGKSYNFTVRNVGDAVTLLSAARRPATVTGTLIDIDPLAVYIIDAMLLPGELFNGSETAPTPAPSPAPATKQQLPPVPMSSDGVAPSPDRGDGKTGDGVHNNGPSVAARWQLAVAVAASVPAIVLVM